MFRGLRVPFAMIEGVSPAIRSTTGTAAADPTLRKHCACSSDHLRPKELISSTSSSAKELGKNLDLVVALGANIKRVLCGEAVPRALPNIRLG
jgi:hypothetical protein